MRLVGASFHNGPYCTLPRHEGKRGAGRRRLGTSRGMGAAATAEGIPVMVLMVRLTDYIPRVTICYR